jgi:hypothetical protein
MANLIEAFRAAKRTEAKRKRAAKKATKKRAKKATKKRAKKATKKRKALNFGARMALARKKAARKRARK